MIIILIIFQVLNIFGVLFIFIYVFRVSVGVCFVYDIVWVMVFLLVDEIISISVCVGMSYNLLCVVNFGFNFVWMLMVGFFFLNFVDFMVVVIDNVLLGMVIYILNYFDDNGCLVIYIFVLNGQDCGMINIRFGDYVWFDLNENGL